MKLLTKGAQMTEGGCGWQVGRFSVRLAAEVGIDIVAVCALLREMETFYKGVCSDATECVHASLSCWLCCYYRDSGRDFVPRVLTSPQESAASFLPQQHPHLGMAMTQYTQDWDERFFAQPPPCDYLIPYELARLLHPWYVAIFPYMRNKQILYCPSVPRFYGCQTNCVYSCKNPDPVLRNEWPNTYGYNDLINHGVDYPDRRSRGFDEIWDRLGMRNKGHWSRLPTI
ncbi:MAG: hypothetical protein N2116_02680, partial [Armatimonadetes bacterium]|nr:hypothetical protein [Armatimonadota bacterium]